MTHLLLTHNYAGHHWLIDSASRRGPGQRQQQLEQEADLLRLRLHLRLRHRSPA
jgi:hypothetical protein